MARDERDFLIAAGKAAGESFENEPYVKPTGWSRDDMYARAGSAALTALLAACFWCGEEKENALGMCGECGRFPPTLPITPHGPPS